MALAAYTRIPSGPSGSTSWWCEATALTHGRHPRRADGSARRPPGYGPSISCVTALPMLMEQTRSSAAPELMPSSGRHGQPCHPSMEWSGCFASSCAGTAAGRAGGGFHVQWTSSSLAVASSPSRAMVSSISRSTPGRPPPRCAWNWIDRRYLARSSPPGHGAPDRSKPDY